MTFEAEAPPPLDYISKKLFVSWTMSSKLSLLKQKILLVYICQDLYVS